MPTLTWHLWPHMLERGWTRPIDLHNATGISKPACKALLADHQPPVVKLHIPTLFALAIAFDQLDDPFALLEYRR